MKIYKVLNDVVVVVAAVAAVVDVLKMKYQMNYHHSYLNLKLNQRVYYDDDDELDLFLIVLLLMKDEAEEYP
jgi:hypothetical protein